MPGNEARRIHKQQYVLNLMSRVVADLDNYHIKFTEHPDGILTISMHPRRRSRSFSPGPDKIAPPLGLFPDRSHPDPKPEDDLWE